MEILRENNPDEKTLGEIIKEFDGNNLSENKLLDLLSNYPESDFCYFLLGQIQKNNNNFDESLKSLLKAEKINPNAIEIKSSIAQVLFKKGDIDNSKNTLDKCLALNPNDKGSNILLAEIFETHKEFDKAILIFENLYNEYYAD